MKKIFANIAIFFKKLSFIYRLIGILGAAYIVFGITIPDIRFNLTAGKAAEMTLNQLYKTPKDDIPRYLKIKDAVVPAGTYVEYRKEKRNSLVGIYYPVYGIDTTSNAANPNAKLVIYDSHVTDEQLDSTGTYFNNPKFTIEGQYDGESLTEETLNLFKESGLNVSADAIVLRRGDTGMTTGSAIGLAIFGLLVMLIGVLSFIPEETLRTW